MKGFGEITGIGMRIVHAVISFLIGVLLARGLGVEGFGEYTFALSWILLAVGLLSAGVPQYLVREVSKKIHEGKLDDVRSLVLHTRRHSQRLAVGAAIICLALAASANTPILQDATLSMIIGVPAVAMLVAASMQDAITRGAGHVISGQVSEFITRPVSQILLLVLFLFFIVENKQFTASHAMTAFTLAATLSVITSALIRTRVTRSMLGVESANTLNASWTTQILGLALIGWVSAANAQIGYLILGSVGDISELGYFRAASQLTQLMPLGLIAIEAHQSPRISKLNTEGKTQLLQHLAVRNARLSLLIAAPVGLVLILLGEPILTAVFGANYANGANAMTLLAIGQLINAGAGSVGIFMISAHLERGVLIALCVATLLNLAMTLALAPVFGAVGAATAACLSLGCWNLIMIVILKRRTTVLSLPIRR